AQLSEAAKVRLHALNVAAFSVAAAVGVGVVALLAITECWHRWLHLPPTGDVVIAITAALTAAMMWFQLLVEPRGRCGTSFVDQGRALRRQHSRVCNRHRAAQA